MQRSARGAVVAVVVAIAVAACGSGGGETSGESVAPTPDSGSLAEGARAEPGTVGYLGDEADLTVLSEGGPTPEGASWVGGTLVVDANDLTLDGVYVQGSIDYYGAGTLTVRDSVVEANGALPAVVWGRSADGHLDLRDSTVRWPADVDPQQAGEWGAGAVNGDSRMTVVRCDISGTPDGVQQGNGHSTFEQNVIHDLRRVGEYPDNTHNDGIQLYGGPEVVVRGNFIDMDGFDGVHQNASLFLAGGPGYTAPIIEDNYFGGGGYMLRIGSGTTDAVVRDNQFGPLDAAFGLVLVDPGVTFAEWTGNLWDDGSDFQEPPPT